MNCKLNWIELIVLFALFRDRNTNVTWLWSCKNALLKKKKTQAKQNKNKIGTSAGFPHAFLWTKKMHLLQLLEIKKNISFWEWCSYTGTGTGQWWIQGRGPLGPAPLLILDLTEAEGPKKTFWETATLPYLREGGLGLPLISRSGSGTAGIWFLVQKLYHWATGDLWQVGKLN